jgi:hypothetical protein
MSYEVRVWLEDGTLLGVAEVIVQDDDNTVVMFSEADQASGYLWEDQRFLRAFTAERYAREWAESYADWLQRTCDCDWPYTETCGIMSEHGISIQYSRDGYTVDELG